MVISATSISEPSTTKLIPPQRKKSLSVSTSETTRLTRLARRSSLWWAMLSAWMWRKVRVRSAASPGQAAAGGPRSQRRQHHDHRAGGCQRQHPAELAAGQVMVDHLLDEHGRDHAAGAGQQRQQNGEADALPQLGRDGQAAAQHAGLPRAAAPTPAQRLLDRFGGHAGISSFWPPVASARW